mgnify:FL=1
MKTYIINFLIETESNTQGETLTVCSDLKTAQKEFKKAVKLAPRYRQSNEDDFREYVTESIVLELWEDDEFVEDISSQVIYSEGQIDRMNYKGDYAVMYYSRATFNGKELMHTMYFQGERENWRKGNYKVPQSKLNEWFYR